MTTQLIQDGIHAAARRTASGFVIASAALALLAPGVARASVIQPLHLGPAVQQPGQSAFRRARGMRPMLAFNSYSFPANMAQGGDSIGGVIDVNGQLYGTAQLGGAYNCGAVFYIDYALTTENVKYNFCQFVPDGALPVAGLYKQGNWVYGSLEEGGSGPGTGYGGAFRLKTTPGLTYNFYPFDGSTSSKPSSPLMHYIGKMWGASARGGPSDAGTIYSLVGSTVTQCYAFSGADGTYPTSNLVEMGGYLYGTTEMGGANNVGTVFKINATTCQMAWSYSFGSFTGDGAYPRGLVKVGNKLYGTTSYGGSGNGTIFTINSAKQEYVIYSFQASGTNGVVPWAAPTSIGTTALIGTTEAGGGTTCTNQGLIGCGTVYEYTLPPSPNSYQTLHAFNGTTEGANPIAGVTFVPSNNGIYGTTQFGGTGSEGTVYSLI